MSQVTAADVKKLREMSGAGMMDCKKALAETQGNLEAAVDFLRKKGLSAASKKAGRVAAEGIVVARTAGSMGVVLEVNSETDFVSKNEKFTDFVNLVADIIMREKPVDVTALKALPCDGTDLNIEQALSQLIATIGENMDIRRFNLVEVNEGTIGTYIHGAGKIGVLVAVEGVSGDDADQLVRGIAMHIAASNPLFISIADVDEDSAAREKAVLSERAIASGKPEAIVDKIVAGQMNKYYSDVCLLEQDFVMDTESTVGKALAKLAKDAILTHMSRFQLGEGIEKEESDFAAEVAAQVAG
ncbi:MAG: elongation factor Ts [Zetaproteobacteria bacterium]|nr:elongation factor Ts [Zetaproteobacteria bacterium]